MSIVFVLKYHIFAAAAQAVETTHHQHALSVFDLFWFGKLQANALFIDPFRRNTSETEWSESSSISLVVLLKLSKIKFEEKKCWRKQGSNLKTCTVLRFHLHIWYWGKNVSLRFWVPGSCCMFLGEITKHTSFCVSLLCHQIFCLNF